MAALLVVLFLVVPIVEIYVIIQVGQIIGGWPTLGLLVAESLFGAWVVRREGRQAWRALRQALGSGRVPDRELADGALLLIGGTLLLTPGFLTDLVGFFLVIPFTRPVARRALVRWIGRRARVTVGGAFPGAAPAAGGPGGGFRRGAGGPEPAGPVVPGEVVDCGEAEGGGDTAPKR
jgi:UPF0716 protein FxsA